jgi:hypothetical protein
VIAAVWTGRAKIQLCRGPEELNNPFFDQAKLGCEGSRRLKGEVQLIGPPEMAAATSRCRSSKT